MNATPELVSVIIPTYNCAKTLPACLESVLGQTYDRIEITVVDDASTDRSADIVKRYDCTLIELPENRGPAAARNRGILASKGGILFFLDADVALAPDAVEKCVRILREHPEYAGVSGLYAPEPLFDDGIIERYQSLHAHYWRMRNAGVVQAGYFSLGALRRSTIDEIGLFDENLRANNNEDTEYGFRIGRRHRMLLTPEITGWHDDDDRLRPLLRKYYLRVSSLVPLLVRDRGQRGTREAAHRPSEIVSAAGLAVTAVLTPAFGAYFAAVPLAFLIAFVCADPKMVGFVRRHAGARFLPAYLAIHFVINCTIAAAAAYGVLRWVFDRRFRRLYERTS
ncbi:glycosyltransferase family 2 protein [Actinomadura miaoliensis]|uniref:Glycosyltransferase 2-like domain-containing protein n=1 Tax=Actinomadura miaoliensis TaxID=430685 RepID=A0ABP7WRG2_9ACTN